MINKKVQTKTASVLPISEEDWTIHSLNIQGTFFERWCQRSIKKSKWNIESTNYPVEFPKHNGPFPGEQSTLDIYAQLEKKTILLTLLVECKKNNPEFINWVFFPSPNPKRLKHFTGSIIANKQTDGTNNRWEPNAMLGPMISIDWVTTGDAWETRGSYLSNKAGDKTKTSNASITHAAHQISLATRALFDEELANSKILSANSADAKMPYIHQILIPTIITTAKLYVCKFDPKNINTATGEIPYSKAKIEEQPYLLYEYPLPVHFQSTPVDKVGVLKSGNKDFGSRMDILVVNSSHLKEFLSKLEKGNA